MTASLPVLDAAPPLDGLAIERDALGRVVAVTGEGLEHRVSRRDDDAVTVTDAGGATTVRIGATVTEVVRGGAVLRRELAGPRTERWRLPGTPGPIDLVRDDDGITDVIGGGGCLARRAEVDEGHLLRWDGGAATGEGPAGPLAQASDGRVQVWTVAGEGDRLDVGANAYRFDAAGRILEHAHPRAGTVQYRYAGDRLVTIEEPAGTVELAHGTDGRPRSRRDPDGLTTYGYDLRGRRVREDGAGGTRRLHWDALDRLVAVDTPQGRVSYAHDGFGRRVARTFGGDTVLEHRDLQGRLWAVTAPDGAALRTFLWDRHRCLARWDGPAQGPPDAVFALDPGGTPVGVVQQGAVRDLARRPFGEPADARPADDRPALHISFADPLTGYLHLVQRDMDPSSRAFLSADPYRGDDRDLRRLLLGASGPLSTERSAVGLPYAVCGHDPVRRIDPNGAVSAGTAVWQIFGGLTWHLPAHIINFLWIHPVVNFSFATILAWLPALGLDRGGFESYYEFWNPANYSYEESERQDVAGFLMAGWMSTNRTFTFQNAIWGRQKRWAQLATTAGFEPTGGFAQQRFGSLLKIHRGGAAADVLDDWTLVASGIDTTFARARQVSVGGGRDAEAIVGEGRDRLLTGANLHLSRDVTDQNAAGDRVSLMIENPGNPGHGLVEFHERATAVQECAPGAAAAQVTLRPAGRIFTSDGADPATADGDVVRVDRLLAIVDGVQVDDPGGPAEQTLLSIRPGSPAVTLPDPGTREVVWGVPGGVVQTLAPHPAGGTRLLLTDAVVAWTAGDAARFGAPLTPVAEVSGVESHVAVLAQDPLPVGAQVRPLAVPVNVVGATLDGTSVRVPDGTVPDGSFVRLEEAATVRIARITDVTDDGTDDLLTLHAEPVALGLPGTGPIVLDLLTVTAARGDLVEAVPAGAGQAVLALAANTAMGANVAGFAVGTGNALAVVTAAETRALVLADNPVGGAGPWAVEQIAFPAGARRQRGALSGPVEMLAFDDGDPATSLPAEALLRLRSVTVPAAPTAVAGLVRAGDTELGIPAGGPALAAGDLAAVQGAAIKVVVVEDVLVDVTLDRPVGTPGQVVRRVCALDAGEATYDVADVTATSVRLSGLVGGAPAFLPPWVEGEILRLSDGTDDEEWVLDHDADGGVLRLREGPAAAIALTPPLTVQRLVPRWPPLAREQTRPGATSAVGAVAREHRWVVGSASQVVTTAPFAVDIGGRARVARVDTVGGAVARTSPLPAGPLTGLQRVAGVSGNDRVVARWRRIGDEVRLKDAIAVTPAGGATLVLDALAPARTVALRPRQQAVMCPAEPEDDRWIFTAREALREHELRHTLQSSTWGPLMLGLPLTVFGDLLWDRRGGAGVEASEFTPVERTEATTGTGARPAGFRTAGAAPAEFRSGPGEVLEFDGAGTAWRSVVTASETSEGRVTFWVHNPPEEDFGGDGLRVRSLHATTPEVDAWMGTFRILDLVSNASIMEFSTGLIWEGLIGLVWRVGRLFGELFGVGSADRVAIRRAGPADATSVIASDPDALAALGLSVGTRVLVDSDAHADDAYSTVITAIEGAAITLRDPLPAYPQSAALRLGRYEGRSPDDLWDLWSYAPARLVDGLDNVLQVEQVDGESPPAYGVLDLLRIKWIDPGTADDASEQARVTAVVDAGQRIYQIDKRIGARPHDPDTLRVTKLGNDDDPNELWFSSHFYETPLRIRRATRYLFDPWRALALDTDVVNPADDAVWRKTLAWILRGARYAFSSRSWTPLFGRVWWSSVFSEDHRSGLEQEASWQSGDLYTTITRSGDPRFAGTEGDYGNAPGDYDIYEGDFLRMWTWESWRWDDVFSSGSRAASRANPALRGGGTPTSPWRSIWRVTLPAALVGPGVPAELYGGAGTVTPQPLLQIPSRPDVARTQGFYFVACEAGTYGIAPSTASTRDQEALDSKAQWFRRDVTVQPLTIQAGAVDLPWQDGSTPPALSLFLTQEVAITVTGGHGGAHHVRLSDNDGAVLWRSDDRSLRARLTVGVVEVEVVRRYEPDDPSFTRFGTYLATTLDVPVRRFQVAVTDVVALRSGPAPTDPVVSGPVAPGVTLSALLPAVATGLPTAVWAPAPANPPPLPAISGPHAADGQHRYDIALNGEPPEDPASLRITFVFSDPHPAGGGATRALDVAADVQPIATLEAPAFEVARGGTLRLVVTPADPAVTVDAAEVTVAAADASPTAGVTVAAVGPGVDVTAAAAASPGDRFVVRALWNLTPLRRTVTVTA